MSSNAPTKSPEQTSPSAPRWRVVGAEKDRRYMRLALRLARRGFGATSPNPMVGAVLVKSGRIIGRGWHRRAGGPHAEIEAMNEARERRYNVKGAILYVTLEPCSTQGRTPPCTQAIKVAGIKRVVVGATDPNPRHRGRAFLLLSRAGLQITHGVLATQCELLNEAFNHWIAQRTPWVTVKAAMTLDGKIATASGESKWITGAQARTGGMRLREGADAILVGINTILADDPSLTVRKAQSPKSKVRSRPGIGNAKSAAQGLESEHGLRRIILDANARTPLRSKVVTDPQAALTTVVVSCAASKKRVAALAKRVRVLVAPATRAQRPHLNLTWLLKRLGAEGVTSLLVEGGGEVNASFLLQGLAHRIAFFYAPKILGGRHSRRAVAGRGAESLNELLNLANPEWKQLGADWFLTASVGR